MIITNNLVSPRNGEPLVAATQGKYYSMYVCMYVCMYVFNTKLELTCSDFLTGAYLLTQKGKRFANIVDQSYVCMYVCRYLSYES